MTITRYSVRRPFYSPWRELEEVSNRLARFFDESPVSAGAETGTWLPAVNVSETSDELMLTAELPGMKQEDITIELENNILNISGTKSEEVKEGDEERRYHMWERRYGAFQRSFTLPHTVKADAIRAHFENGILEVHLPKSAEAKGRKILIEKGK
ncbi:MAG: Hsp20/alpha crystallin family protein [Gemmatimonadota bacterium]|nr:Hsp20/alpha crystallin family protein [Gemmatimonadota bacterium]MDH5759146.1 Hsp20/alpha crystallin family protein [Gemmatimonadota bacterium]